MGRRIANQVHHQVSRLMRGNIISHEPKWYQPVLNFPPLPLPPRAPPARTAYDLKMKSTGRRKMVPPKNQPFAIHYIEDDIRRQFYRDHPFEAFRPTTLVEKGDIELHEVRGATWTRLRQRGRNPLPEDAIEFALNLHQQHQVPLSQAYARAVAQFRALRSEHHIATTFAVMEAEELGAVFVRGEIEHAFDKEKRAIATWEKLAELDEGQLAARKRWKAIAERHQGMSNWSRGVEYVKMWRAGIRINYSPALTRPVEETEEEYMARERNLQPASEEDMQEQAELMSTEELDALVQRVMGDVGEGLISDSEFEEDEEEGDEEEEIAEAEGEKMAGEPEADEAETTGNVEEGSDFYNFTRK